MCTHTHTCTHIPGQLFCFDLQVLISILNCKTSHTHTHTLAMRAMMVVTKLAHYFRGWQENVISGQFATCYMDSIHTCTHINTQCAHTLNIDLLY